MLQTCLCTPVTDVGRELRGGNVNVWQMQSAIQQKLEDIIMHALHVCTM